MSDSLWTGLRAEARHALETRDYSRPPLEARVTGGGVPASALVDLDSRPDWWIPGVEVFARRVFQQPSRGHFSEFARQGQGVLGEIGFWPRQWATALMFSHTSKGFHIHPPHIPKGTTPEAWFTRLYGDDPAAASERPYDKEQWDAMFFVTGRAEMLLADERVGLARRRMRFTIEGDDRPGPDNAGVVIPAGVSHAIRNTGPGSLVMVYGTSTTFVPENEGRIASGVENAPLPVEWDRWFHGR